MSSHLDSNITKSTWYNSRSLGEDRRRVLRNDAKMMTRKLTSGVQFGKRLKPQLSQATAFPSVVKEKEKKVLLTYENSQCSILILRH